MKGRILIIVLCIIGGIVSSKAEEKERILPRPLSIYGGSGLLRLNTAGLMPKKTFSIGSYIGFSYISDYLSYEEKGNFSNQGDASIHFAYGIWNYIEGYASLYAHTSTLENNTTGEHNAYHAIGDFLFGIKATYPFFEWMRAGGGLFLKLLTKAGKVLIREGGTCIGLNLIASFELENFVHIPMNAHVNFGYIFSGAENLRFPRDEKQWLLMNALPSDYILFGIGLEFPLPQYYIIPYIEYSTEQYIEKAIFGKVENPASLRKPHWNENPQRFTLGVRGVPWKGLWMDIALDLSPTKSLTITKGIEEWSTRRFPLWQIFFGVGYSFFPEFIGKEKVSEAKYTPPGRIKGKAVNKDTLKGIKYAMVEVEGAPFSTILTSEDGTFVTPSLPPGKYKVKAIKTRYKKAEKIVEVTSGRETEVQIEMEYLKNIGGIKGIVTDIAGVPLSAVIIPENPEIPPIVTDPTTGKFFGILPVGNQVLTIKSEGYVGKKIRVPVKKMKIVKFSVRMRPEKKQMVIGAIEGYVVNEKGEPLPASINFYGGLHPPVGTDKDGKFLVKLPPGTYKFKVESKGYTTKVFKIEVKPRVKKRVKIVMKPRTPAGMFAGRVLNEKKEPLPASIIFDDIRVPATATDPETGYFKVKAPPGEYVVTVSSKGYIKRKFKINIKDGVKLTANIILKEEREEVKPAFTVEVYSACDNEHVAKTKAKFLEEQGYKVTTPGISKLGKLELSQVRYFPPMSEEAMKIGDAVATQFLPIEDPMLPANIIQVHLGCGYIK